MPSGAKKRKAAKRKKEREQRQLLGVHPPASTSPLHSAEGNGVEEEEEEEMMSHDGKESESGSDFPSSMEQDNHQSHLEVYNDDELAEAKDEEKNKIEADSTGVIDIIKVMGSMQNGGEKRPRESLRPQKTDEDAKEIMEIHVSPIEVKENEVLPPPSLDLISSTSTEVSISETETTVKRVQSEKAEQVLVLGSGPPPVEHKQWEAIDTAKLVERPVSISEGVEQVMDSLVTSHKAEEVAEALTNGNEERIRVLHLSDAIMEETDQSFKIHHCNKRHEVAGTTEVAWATQLEQRTSWLSCCGLFDVITGANR